MEITKITLKEIKRLIDYYLQTIDDYSTDEIGQDNLINMKNIIKCLNVSCECDDYNGFDCGCTKRSNLEREAIKEIDSVLANEG